jgi:hypothetical protein
MGRDTEPLEALPWKDPMMRDIDSVLAWLIWVGDSELEAGGLVDPTERKIEANRLNVLRQHRAALAASLTEQRPFGLRQALRAEVAIWRENARQHAKPEDKDADEGYAAGLGRAAFAVEELLAATEEVDSREPLDAYWVQQTLLTYGRHQRECRAWKPNSDCSCGWGALLDDIIKRDG